MAEGDFATARRRVRTLAGACALAAVPAVAMLGIAPRPKQQPVAAPRPTTVAAPVQPAADGRSIVVRRQDGPFVGKRVPEVSFREFDGRTVSLRGLQGSLLVVNLFASWCPSCRDEIPQLTALSASLSREVRFAAIAVNDDAKAAAAMIDEIGSRGLMTIGADYDGSVRSKLLVFGIPGTIVVGPDGIVSADWRGPVPSKVLTDFLRKTYPQVEKEFGGS